ncbi:MAG: hypothetical protein DI628_01245 [Blastochloris viridis]|uniref:Uncharacterized protein n=1 Tax=Blastochloris viridis TaxID=1079 RepID=A0A6N4RE19_BLAVI|nr:MAG: hypothetical protein DI628_01245 [Blastochloris viridis]
MKSLILVAFVAATTSQAFAQSSAHTNWGLKTGDGGNAPVERMHVLGDYAGKVNDGAGLTGSLTTIYQETIGVKVEVQQNGDGNQSDVKVDQNGNVSGVQRVKTVKK